MKAIYGIAIVIAFVFAATSLGYAQWGTSKVLMEGWKAFQKVETNDKSVVPSEYLLAGAYAGYIMGFLHGTMDTYKIPARETPKQLFEVVGKYLDAHQDKWSEPPYKIVFQALSKAFPK
jgi:hypothetical protein